jgi:hypothetical protein
MIRLVTNIDSEYINNLEPKLVRLLSLIQDYKVAKEYEELSEQGNKIEETNKKLKHLLETCYRVRTQPDDDPPIPLGDGRYLVTIAEDPTAW